MAIPGAFGVGIQSYGDLVPLLEKTLSGKTAVHFRDKPGLGETIVNKATGTGLSNIPERYHSILEKAKLFEFKKQLSIDRAKRLVLETGRPIRVGNSIVYLDRGIVKTKTYGSTVTPEKVLAEQLSVRK